MSYLTIMLIAAAGAGALILLHGFATIKKESNFQLDEYEKLLQTSREKEEGDDEKGGDGDPESPLEMSE